MLQSEDLLNINVSARWCLVWFVVLVSLATFLVAPQFAQAAFGDPLPTIEGTPTGNLTDAIGVIINGLLGLAALAALVFVIIGGFRYIFAQGDSDAAESAKRTILYAVLGLIVIALAYALVDFILTAVDPTT